MRLGLVLPNMTGAGIPETRSAIKDLAQLAEDAGFASVWTNDHLIIPRTFTSPYPYSTDGRFRYQSGQSFYDAVSVLTWVAGMTHRVRLGTATLIPALRHPVYTAKLLATLDALSDGRLTVGVGLGWLREEMRLLGAPADLHRGALTDESVAVYRELWTAGSASFRGRWYSFDDLEVLPKPLQRPHPPIWIGGNSAAALDRAARLGQGWHSQQTTPEEFERNARRLAELLAERGRAAAGFDYSCTCEIRIDDAAGAGPDAQVEYGPGRRLPQLRGRADQLAHTLRRFERAGATHISVRASFAGAAMENDLSGTVRAAQVVAERILPGFDHEIRPDPATPAVGGSAGR